MLSILIPLHNYNVVPLVEALREAMKVENIPYEIIILNDASTHFLEENSILSAKPSVHYEILETNIGRSKIRNLLAKKAKYDWLLFLDTDVLPKAPEFLSNYFKYMDTEAKVVYGGILYTDNKPEQSRLLRWIYGRQREALSSEIRTKKPYISFLTLNFLIRKSILNQVSFNESIPNLRHEDTLFSYNLQQQRIPIIHIDNPVYHLGLDKFDAALRKENEALLALKNLLDQDLIAYNYTKISRIFLRLKRWNLVNLISFLHRKTHRLFIQNLASSKPSLFIYDIYRLGYLCNLYRSK